MRWERRDCIKIVEWPVLGCTCIGGKGNTLTKHSIVISSPGNSMCSNQSPYSITSRLLMKLVFGNTPCIAEGTNLDPHSRGQYHFRAEKFYNISTKAENSHDNSGHQKYYTSR